MCGRFSFVTTLEKVAKDLGTHLESDGDLLQSYNVAPTQKSYVITDKEPHLLQAFYWGLVPHWSKTPKLSGQLINARKETVLTKPSFRESVRQRRCLVVVDSFYEWKQSAHGKQPYRIRMEDNSTMCFAGIWDSCVINQKQVFSFAILTHEADEQMATIHNRMPVFLPVEKDRNQWLGKMSEQELAHFLAPLRTCPLTIAAVSPSVNSVKNNGPHLHTVYVPPPTLF